MGMNLTGEDIFFAYQIPKIGVLISLILMVISIFIFSLSRSKGWKALACFCLVFSTLLVFSTANLYFYNVTVLEERQQKIQQKKLDDLRSLRKIQEQERNYNENMIFQEASAKYDVPQDILRGVYFKETRFGLFMGKHLAYKKLQGKPLHLRALQRIALENNLDYKKIKGSVAGAIGYTQFMPYWWEYFGVDADQDGKKNPFCLADAIHTSAHFLREHYDKTGTWWSAIKAYNHDSGYVVSVLKTAELISKKPGKYLS